MLYTNFKSYEYYKIDFPLHNRKPKEKDMLQVLRETENYLLNAGTGMANGMFNISDKEGRKLSLWFDKNSKDEFMEMTDKEFDEVAEGQVS